jgi:hypothetical protein
MKRKFSCLGGLDDGRGMRCRPITLTRLLTLKTSGKKSTAGDSSVDSKPALVGSREHQAGEWRNIVYAIEWAAGTQLNRGHQREDTQTGPRCT